MSSEDGGGRKRTRTWSEIDRNRGRSKHLTQQTDHKQERLQQTQSYQDYKKSVEKIFGGGGDVPDSLKDQLDPTGSKGKRDAAIRQLKELEAEDRKAYLIAVGEFAESNELPEDPYLLDGLLDHPRPRVVDKALSALELMATAGKLGAKRPRSLEQRLRSIELTSLDDEQKERARKLRERLG
jgi:hypothetical protein